MDKIIEVRAYNLQPGTRDEFHGLVIRESLPMLRRWNVDVVAFGPSPHDDNSYYLIRAYKSLEDRQQTEDAFYSSDEWLQGPRQAIVSRIESLTSIVLQVDEGVLEGLRRRPE
jgi:hypothetical protein